MFRLAPNVRGSGWLRTYELDRARVAGALAVAVAVLVGGCGEAGDAQLPDLVREDGQLLDPGRSAGWTYTGFIDVGTPAHFPTRHVVNSAEVPLRVAAVTVEGSGDASLVSRISLVPLEAEGVRSADGIVVGGSSFPWVDGLVAIDPAGATLEPGGSYALMVTFEATEPSRFRMDRWILTYLVDREERRLELPDVSGVVAVPDRTACAGLTAFEDEC